MYESFRSIFRSGFCFEKMLEYKNVSHICGKQSDVFKNEIESSSTCNFSFDFD